MPIFHYTCTCGATRRRVCRAKDAPESVPCTCGQAAGRAPRPPGLSVVEELDNGLTSRRVTRYADAEEVWGKHRQLGRKPT